MQDIKERQRKIQMQTQGCVSRFEPLLYALAFKQKDLHYVHPGPFTKGTLSRNYNTNREYTTPLSFSSTQEEGTKPDTKQRKKYNLVIQWSQALLVISKDHKQSLSQYKILEDRFELKNSSMWVHKAFEKENTKKILEKNS